MMSLEALCQKLKQLFKEGVLKIDVSEDDLATETTLSSIDSKVTKADTDNVKVVDEVAYDDTNDWKKTSIENDSAGLAKESTLSSLDSKVIKANTDAIKTIWDYAVENDLAFAGGEVFSIDSDGSVDVLFANPSGSGKTIKIRLLAAQGGAEGKTEIYTGSYGAEGAEDIVKTADGTDIPKVNKKVGGTNTSVAVLQYDDVGGKYTVNTSNKTENLIPGGSGNFATGGPATVGLAGAVLEGYAILVRVTNTSSQSASFGVRLEWWED